jgi:hypothetical protein
MSRGFESHERDRNPRTPAKAFGTRLLKWAKPENFRWATEGIEEAQIRASELPDMIQEAVSGLMGLFRDEHLRSQVSPQKTQKRITKIRWLIGDTIPDHVQYAFELEILARFEKSLSQN